MAGYSNAPLARKLGFKDGHQVALLGPVPTGLKDALCLDAPATKIMTRAAKQQDVIVWFVTDMSTLNGDFVEMTKRLPQHGALWVAWPKRASKVKTDITEDVVREIALPRGWVDTKVCAIDEKWSGLRLTMRVALRA